MRPSVGEDLAQGGGEGIRFAHAAVLAADEPVVAAWEGDGLGPEPFGQRYGRPASYGLAGLRSDRHDDAGRCSPERIEVVPVARARRHVQARKRVIAETVVGGRQPERGQIGPGWSANPAGIGPW
jgi:hypothetical protein